MGNLPELASEWFRRLQAVSDPELRLLCFPHAGGTAGFYRSWPRLVAPGIEVYSVRYPGREDRLDEPCADCMEDLVAGITAATKPLLDEPSLRPLIGLLTDELAELKERVGSLAAADRTVVAGRQGFLLADRFARVLAAACCLGVWQQARTCADSFLADHGWLAMALRRLAADLGRSPNPVAGAVTATPGCPAVLLMPSAKPRRPGPVGSVYFSARIPVTRSSLPRISPVMSAGPA